jgi:glycosyltransferase involved in cell wall biosynthesis
MKLTIVTPSYNQGQFLEETIDSVLSQNVPDLEYIIMDGGSTDNSVEIIRKYERFLAYWQSAPDDGQASAITAGFARGSGDILAWINSDDLYEPGILAKVESLFETRSATRLLYGDYSLLYPDGRLVQKPKISFDFKICLHSFLMIPQPSSFWSRDVWEAVGGVNPKYHLAFDYDFFLRAARYLEKQPSAIVHIPEMWSRFRVHESSKSVLRQDAFNAEHQPILQQFGVSSGSLQHRTLHYYHLLRALVRFHQECGFIPTRRQGGKA